MRSSTGGDECSKAVQSHACDRPQRDKAPKAHVGTWVWLSSSAASGQLSQELGGHIMASRTIRKLGIVQPAQLKRHLLVRAVGRQEAYTTR